MSPSTIESSGTTHGSGRAARGVSGLLAAASFAWHGILVSKATNDNYLHLTLAKQLLGGDLPVRDFYEHAWVLQYALSALALGTLGDRLLAEALIVGLAWAVSTYLVFSVVRRLTGSTTAAVVSALLVIVAGPRGYAYPKGISYAAAAVLWWRYISRPTARNAVAYGVWTAVAFYWRPDHGVYVGCGFVLAVAAVHGVGRVALARCALAAGTAFALVAPFLVFVQLSAGLVNYATTSAVQARAEHTTHGTHAWPIFRYSNELLEFEPAETYAPVITVRWAAMSSAAGRQALMARYDLTHVSSEDPRLERVRLSATSLRRLRQLLNEPLVEDTAGVDRSTAAVLRETWPLRQRLSFEYSWLRIRLLPRLTPQARASELLVVLFYLLPLAALGIAVSSLHGHVGSVVTRGALAAFALFALLVNVGLLRTPYAARAVDAIVLQSILCGCILVAFWRAGGAARRFRRPPRLAAIVVAVLLLTTTSGAGQFGDRLSWLAGQWTSLRSARGAWDEVYGELTASPPLRYFVGRPAGVSLRLAAYVRDCVPAPERIAVLWFAPEVHYHSDRLMAQRHLVFIPAWAALDHEQRATLAKIRRYAPPLVLARRSSLNIDARATYPDVVRYVERYYHVAGALEENNEEYLIFARRDRPQLRAFGAGGWPCYVARPSEWSLVGLAGR